MRVFVVKDLTLNLIFKCFYIKVAARKIYILNIFPRLSTSMTSSNQKVNNCPFIFSWKTTQYGDVSFSFSSFVTKPVFPWFSLDLVHICKPTTSLIPFSSCYSLLNPLSSYLCCSRELINPTVFWRIRYWTFWHNKLIVWGSMHASFGLWIAGAKWHLLASGKSPFCVHNHFFSLNP